MNPWSALRAELQKPVRPANSITAREWAQEFSLSPRRAQEELDRLVVIGKLEKQKLSLDGHLANVYVPVEAHDAAHSHDGHIGRMDRVG